MANKRGFFFQGDALLLPVDFPETSLEFEVPLDAAENFTSPDVFTISALDEETEIHAASILPETPLPKNWKSIPARQALAMTAAGNVNSGKLLRACHVAQWRQDSRFCGKCGAQNIDAPGNTAPQRCCSKCGKNEFPRICPAVIIAITNDENKILLAHNKRFKTNVYSHISGFNEAGETLEETVEREIFEEIKIKVRGVKYVKSQPWPFPNSLMIGFKARYASGTIQPDGEEILDAKWFAKDSLPELPGEGSLSRLLINHWLDDAL